MKATEILQSITDALSVNLSEEVTLSEMKLKNGTVLEAEEFASENEEEMKEDLEEAPEVKEEEKAELEYATKEELNEVKSIVEEIKAMLDPKEEEVDASVVEAKEEIEELKAELAKPATQPLKHSPESSTERKMNLYSQKGALTTLDKVMQKISNFK